ncbi:MAG: hypothetical protein ABSB59_44550 [Streptosporangiaceae bacterium]|jgi:hypothetical protein
MTLPRSAADVLARHVVFELECIDRIYCNLYVPKLQRELGVASFIREHLGKPVASTAVLAARTEAFYAEIRKFAGQHGIPVVEFASGQRKDDVMREHLEQFLAAGRTEGVVFIGRAQEKVRVFATTRRRDAEGKSYPWIVRASRVVTQWYFYCYDACAGPFFLKYCGYFPYNAKLCLNGNEYAKAMAARAGIGFTALDNGFAAVDDVTAVQSICDSFDENVIWDLAAKWTAIVPCPFTAQDTAAGYRYEVSVLQAEFSLTQVLDKPVTGRIFFEQVIRDNLDIGRPDQVGLIFGRRIMRTGPRTTPGRFRTRVITSGVIPTLHIDYKHSKIKQYHKEGKALRTETTINDPGDFGIGKRLHNLPALRTAGFAATRRLLDVQKISHDPADGQAAIAQITAPVTTAAGTRIAAMRLADPRVHALLAALCVFRLLPRGFANRDLRPVMAQILGVPAETITPGKMTYDLRRLRYHGLIERIPGTFRYQVTGTGIAQALFLTRLHDRFLRTGLSDLATRAGTGHSLAAASRAYTSALDDLARQAGLAA